MQNQKQIQEFLKNEHLPQLIEKELCERSLAYFIKTMWRWIDPADYKANWHIDAICEHLEACKSRQIKRLIINVPPRSCKSLTVAVSFPAWTWATDPSESFLFASYSSALSIRDSVKSRRLLDAPMYQQFWGHQFSLTSDQNLKQRYENNQGGYRIATSVDGTLTGDGAGIICFPGETKVYTEDGFVQIADIVVAKEPIRVWSLNKTTGETELKKLSGWHRNPGSDLVRVTFDNYLTIDCTPDHKIWTQTRGMVAVQELWPGDMLPCLSPADASGKPPLRLPEKCSPVDIYQLSAAKTTYCLTVEDNNTFYVGDGQGIFAVANCVDDGLSAKDAGSPTVRETCITWWDEAMSTRLNDPATGVYVIIMQRLHEEDLTGHILAKNHKDWVHLRLPAEFESHNRCKTSLPWQDPRKKENELLWPERVPRKTLEDLKAAMGSYAAAGQLQQRPAPREGGMLQRDWFEIVRTIPNRMKLKTIRWWDLAATEKTRKSGRPDYTVGAKLSLDEETGVVYVEDIARLQKSSHEVEKVVTRIAASDDVYASSTKRRTQIWMEQEPGSSGKSLISHYLRNVLQGYPFRGEVTRKSKTYFIESETLLGAGAEGGIVKLVRGAWNEDFLQEAAMFPNGANDDMVDAVSKAYAKLTTRKKRVGVW